MRSQCTSHAIPRNAFPSLPEATGLSDAFLELNEVLLKACHNEKSQRYESASAMAADLKAVANGKSVRRLHQLEVQLRRMRKSGAALVAAFVVVASAFYGLDQSWQRVREQNARVMGAKVGQGTGLLRQGDILAALPMFVDALALDERNLAARDTHRLRIGSALASCPKVEQIWHLPHSPIRSCALHGRWALATCMREYSQVFDTETGLPLCSPLGIGTLPERESSFQNPPTHRRPHLPGNNRASLPKSRVIPESNGLLRP